MNRLKHCAVVLTLWVACPAMMSAATITDVVETGGDNEPTDTITAKWTGASWTVTVANEPVPGLAVGASYTAGLFGDSAPTYVDRGHRYANDAANNLPIPAYLVGGEYIMSGNDNRDNAGYKLDVTVSTPARVYMLIDNRLSDGDNTTPPTFDATHMQWILDQQWNATTAGLNRFANPGVPDEVPIDESSDGTINQYFSVYWKDFPAGTFSLLQADNAGRNMYGVAVQPVPEPSTVVMLLAAAVLVIMGRALRRRGH